MVPANATPPLLGDDAPVHFVLMIAVVTGSSGFIGSHVVDALLARGATVRVLRRPESPASHDPRDVDFLKAFKEARRRIAFHAAPRDQALSVVYVRDLVHAVLLAGDHPAASGRTYFVAAGDVVTWNHIYRGVAKLAGTVPLEIQLPRAAMWVAGRAGNLLSLVSGRHFLLNANKIALSRPRWWLGEATRAKRELA